MPKPGPFPVSNLPVASNIETNMDINLSCLIDEHASQQPHEQQSQVLFPAQHPMPKPGPFPVSNLPVASNIETNMDINLSCLIDEHASQQPHQQQYVHMRAYARANVGTSTGGDSGDLARDIMNRNAQVAIPEPPPPRTHQCVLTSLSTIFCQEMINIMPGNQLHSKNEAQG
jgi:hypothetical protein